MPNYTLIPLRCFFLFDSDTLNNMPPRAKVLGPVLDEQLPQAIKDAYRQHRRFFGTGGVDPPTMPKIHALLAEHKQDMKKEFARLIRSEGTTSGNAEDSLPPIQDLYGSVGSLLGRLETVERCNAVSLRK